MHHQVRTRRARARRAALVSAPAALVVAALVLAGLGAGPVAADPVQDQNRATAAELADRVMKADATVRSARFALPAAEAAVLTTAALVDAARAEEGRIQVAGPPAPGVGAGGVVDNATDAIIDELAPEQSSAAVIAAEQAAAAAVKRRDVLKFSLQSAVKDRAATVASLLRSGQRRTWWCVSLLDRLGAPVTSESLRGLFAWIDAESNAAHLRNPLATTEGAPGAHNANSVGVKGYPSNEIGLAATIRTLHNGNYPGILAALERGDSALALTQAVASSPWGTGANATRRLLSSG
jgi:hypothetical protein